MSRYAGRHRPAQDEVTAVPLAEPDVAAVPRLASLDASVDSADHPAPRSRTRRVVRVVGGATAVALLGVGAVS